MVDPETVGRTIRGLRLERGLSQAKLAKELSVDVKTVSRLENGDFLPSLETIVALSHAFGRPVEDVLGMGGAAPGDADARMETGTETDAQAGMSVQGRPLEERVAELERLFAEFIELQAEHMRRASYRL
jgi:transcriptional regulator with XRE-family HTH domain